MKNLFIYLAFIALAFAFGCMFFTNDKMFALLFTGSCLLFAAYLRLDNQRS